MIHTLACSITYFFEKRGLLEEKNKDICCYGLGKRKIASTCSKSSDVR